MLRCANELAAFLLPARTSYTSEVLRLRAGLTRLDAIAANQLVGGMLFSAAGMLVGESGEKLVVSLEVAFERLQSCGEELPAFVTSMAAFFGATRRVPCAGLRRSMGRQ